MEGEVVGLVAGVVGSHGTFELERDGIVDVVVGRILPVGSLTGGVVGILQLLLEGRNVGLRGDGHITGHGHDVGGGGLSVRNRVVLVLDQVVARRHLSGGVGVIDGRGRLGIGRKIRGDGVRGRLRIVIHGLGSQVGDRLQFRIGDSGTVLCSSGAPLDVGQLAISQITSEDLIGLIGMAILRTGDGIGLIRERSARAHETSDCHGNGGEHRNQSVDCPLHN